MTTASNVAIGRLPAPFWPCGYLSVTSFSKRVDGSGRKILVIANCQTGGLTACLDIFMPGDNVTGQHWFDTAEARASMAAAAAEADIIVTSAPPELRAQMTVDHDFDESKCLIIPSIHFAGFHPDLTIAYSDGKPISVTGGDPYHSAIGVWCWKQGMEPSEARRLFVPETMSALAFDRYWATAVKQSRYYFDLTSIPFGDFFLPLQASGRLFMHVLNHPHISAIAQLARVVARRLGADEAAVRQPAEHMVPDALSQGAVWPVYPGVADSLALPASTLWKFRNTFYDIDGYLDLQFRALEEAGSPVTCAMSDDRHFDAVMRKAAAQ